jgi:type II secretory pathway pseudopilin PulG
LANRLMIRKKLCHPYRRCADSGFALVELLVALAVGLFLTAGILQVLLSSQSSFRAEQSFSELQENARFSVQVLARDMRISRSLGCSSLMLDEVRGTLSTQACMLRTNPASCSGDSILRGETPLGYDADFSGSRPTQRGDWSSLPQTVRDRWVRGDALALWGVFGSPRAVSTGTLSSSDRAAAVELVDDDPDIRRNDLALITDCESSDVFFVTDTHSSDRQLVHGVAKVTAPDLGSQVNVKDPNDATRAPLSRAYNAVGSRQLPGVRNKAMVYPFDYRVYYLCCTDGNDGSLDDNPAHCRTASPRYRTSLCRWSASSGKSDQLVNDIADLRVTYSGDVNGDGALDFVDADAKTVTDANNWPNVYSAQVEILAASHEDVRTTAREAADPTWPPNDPANPPAADAVAADTLGAGIGSDRRRFDRFVFTVALRSRTPWYVQR